MKDSIYEKCLKESAGRQYYVLLAGKGPQGDLNAYSILGIDDAIEELLANDIYGWDLLEDEYDCVPFDSRSDAEDIACRIIREVSTSKDPVLATVISAEDARKYITINY